MLDKKIIYNSFVSSGARVIGLALSLITIGFISRYLGQDGFGYYATVLAFLYFFTILSDLGLYSICLREISRPGADEAKIFSNAFTLRFFAGMVIFGLSPLIVWFFPYPTEIKFGVLIGAIGFWLMSNQQVLMGVFQKYLKTDKVALAEVSGRLVQLLSVIFIVRKEMGFFYSHFEFLYKVNSLYIDIYLYDGPLESDIEFFFFDNTLILRRLRQQYKGKIYLNTM